jgi:hypothetical protein
MPISTFIGAAALSIPVVPANATITAVMVDSVASTYTVANGVITVSSPAVDETSVIDVSYTLPSTGGSGGGGGGGDPVVQDVFAHSLRRDGYLTFLADGSAFPVGVAINNTGTFSAEAIQPTGSVEVRSPRRVLYENAGAGGGCSVWFQENSAWTGQAYDARVVFALSSDYVSTTAPAFVGVATAATPDMTQGIGGSFLATCAGLAFSPGVSSNLLFVNREAFSVVTPVDLGSGFPANGSAYDFRMSRAEGSSELTWSVTNLDTGDVATGSVTDGKFPKQVVRLSAHRWTPGAAGVCALAIMAMHMSGQLVAE